jgi:ABC-2 type transport system permease protein
MKNILNIVMRDIRSGIRDWLIVYLFIAPFLLAFILRLLIPGTGDSMIHVVVAENDPLISVIEQYARVETVKTEEEIRERVLRMDDAIGVVSLDRSYRIVMQGNEPAYSAGLLSSLLERISNPNTKLPIEIRLSDIEWEVSPLKLQGGALLIILSTIFAGMFIVLNLVDEKMHNTLRALNVTPVSRFQLVAGKSVIGLLYPPISCTIAAWILGFSGLNIPMFIFTVFTISLISIIIGFGIGTVNDDPIAAVASMKVVFLPVLASFFGAMFLSPKWQWILYWSPFYWAYKSVNAILLQEAIWSRLILHSSLIVLITALVFLALRKRIQNGLE